MFSFKTEMRYRWHVTKNLHQKKYFCQINDTKYDITQNELLKKIYFMITNELFFMQFRWNRLMLYSTDAIEWFLYVKNVHEYHYPNLQIPNKSFESQMNIRSDRKCLFVKSQQPSILT